MATSIGSYIKRGYIPLAVNRHAGIAWQGEPLHDFWMWNRQFIEEAGGGKVLQTVKVNDIKEAAKRYYCDGWVPIKKIDAGLLRRMEAALRRCSNLRDKLPQEEFLKDPDPLPEEYLSHGLKTMVRGER
ncbi:MAG: hypothetical protein HY955_07815 [Deltaproteobacteria bacterium]|nr:hypothetical protein [Deltaproteobacteria bacterium]